MSAVDVATVGRVSVLQACEEMAKVVGIRVAAQDVLGGGRTRRISLVRRRAVQLMHERGLTHKEIAMVLGRHHSTVSYHLSKAGEGDE